jgi:hypothetical protein
MKKQKMIQSAKHGDLLKHVTMFGAKQSATLSKFIPTQTIFISVFLSLCLKQNEKLEEIY